MAVACSGRVVIDYTNWEGVRSKRHILPIKLWFGSNERHPIQQYLLEALDLDKKEVRYFALRGIHSWEDQ